MIDTLASSSSNYFLNLMLLKISGLFLQLEYINCMFIIAFDFHQNLGFKIYKQECQLVISLMDGNAFP